MNQTTKALKYFPITLEAIITISGLTLLFILFRPHRDPYGRRVTKPYNGQHYGKARELY